jgi:hypothetical protein
VRKRRAVETSKVAGRGGVSPVSTCLTTGEFQPLASRARIRRVDERRAPSAARPITVGQRRRVSVVSRRQARRVSIRLTTGP